VPFGEIVKHVSAELEAKDDDTRYFPLVLNSLEELNCFITHLVIVFQTGD
jgi:hypothetical protein